MSEAFAELRKELGLLFHDMWEQRFALVTFVAIVIVLVGAVTLLWP